MFRIENRSVSKTISICQSGFGDDASILLEPLSTTNFSWEDPYGLKVIDAKVHCDNIIAVYKFNLESTGECSVGEGPLRLKFHVVEMGDIKVARFTDDWTLGSSSHEEIRFLTPAGNWGNSHMQSRMQSRMQNNVAPVELIIELGVFGISIIDHRPKELLYLYLESVSISYSTGYDGGTTNR